MAVYGGKGNSSRVYQHRFLSGAAKVVQPGERVLDAGAGRAPYRKLFRHARYETPSDQTRLQSRRRVRVAITKRRQFNQQSCNHE